MIARAHACTHARTHTHAHTYIHASTHTHTHTQLRMHIRTCMHSRMPPSPNTRTHSHTHTHTHTHTHNHHHQQHQQPLIRAQSFYNNVAVYSLGHLRNNGGRDWYGPPQLRGSEHREPRRKHSRLTHQQPSPAHLRHSQCSAVVAVDHATGQLWLHVHIEGGVTFAFLFHVHIEGVVTATFLVHVSLPLTFASLDLCQGDLWGREGHKLLIIILMYIYHAVINALSAHIIHINLNMIFYMYVEDSPTRTIYIRHYMETHTHTPLTSVVFHQGGLSSGRSFIWVVLY